MTEVQLEVQLLPSFLEARSKNDFHTKPSTSQSLRADTFPSIYNHPDSTPSPRTIRLAITNSYTSNRAGTTSPQTPLRSLMRHIAACFLLRMGRLSFLRPMTSADFYVVDDGNLETSLSRVEARDSTVGCVRAWSVLCLYHPKHPARTLLIHLATG